MSKKQEVATSEAAANTKIVKRTKNLMKLDVSRVKVAGELRKIRFVAKNKHGGVVIARTRGLPPMRIRCVMLRHRDEFWVTIRGNEGAAIATTPDKAFARGVKAFWS
jgi:hypothetical protein